MPLVDKKSGRGTLFSREERKRESEGSRARVKPFRGCLPVGNRFNSRLYTSGDEVQHRHFQFYAILMLYAYTYSKGYICVWLAIAKS